MNEIIKMLIVITISYLAFMSVFWATGGSHKDVVSDLKMFFERKKRVK